jgi:hypothetical protein
MTKAPLALGLLTAMALAVAFLALGDSSRTADAGGGGMEAISVDADITGNTATSLGERDECIEVNAGDSVQVDVTALNIPASNPMITFNYRFRYDEDAITVTAADHQQLISSGANSSIPPLDAGDPIPDSDGEYLATVVDIDTSNPESGSGVLSRLTVMVDAGAANGGYILGLVETVHIDDNNELQTPENINPAQLAVGVTCDSLPPPIPEFLQGDIDCDGDVDAVDALQLLRHVAGLGANQGPDCPEVGAPIGDTIFGDIDCDGDVDAVDALLILRFIAGLPTNQPNDCQPLGQ